MPFDREQRVYPRVGGETSTRLTVSGRITGLSPRGRGNPVQIVRSNLDIGSIPAWAGKPAIRGNLLRVGQVYPRVGGETISCRLLRSRGAGLSPRGRGNRSNAVVIAEARRSIPAWAGKPYQPRAGAHGYSVYPRVGGETKREGREVWELKGLSPRGRGNHGRGTAAREYLGSIPAWAGKPLQCGTAAEGNGVYPRVGGETDTPPNSRFGPWGLSPRGRGNHRGAQNQRVDLGSIPAWAGKPNDSRGHPHRCEVYPRVGGETVEHGEGRATIGGLSPRGRGNHAVEDTEVCGHGSIPAWAGKPERPSRP